MLVYAPVSERKVSLWYFCEALFFKFLAATWFGWHIKILYYKHAIFFFFYMQYEIVVYQAFIAWKLPVYGQQNANIEYADSESTSIFRLR